MEVEAQISSLLAQIEQTDSRMQSRLAECKTFLASIYATYDGIAFDITEAKSK